MKGALARTVSRRAKLGVQAVERGKDAQRSRSRYTIKQTSENSASNTGVVRARALAAHWRWVSKPRWRRPSAKVTSMTSSKTNRSITRPGATSDRW